VVVRADAAVAKPDVYETLEVRGVKHAIRIPSSDTLEQAVAELLRRPVGRPSHPTAVEDHGSAIPTFASEQSSQREKSCERLGS
jgi:hypothetical protein